MWDQKIATFLPTKILQIFILSTTGHPTQTNKTYPHLERKGTPMWVNNSTCIHQRQTQQSRSGSFMFPFVALYFLLQLGFLFQIEYICLLEYKQFSSVCSCQIVDYSQSRSCYLKLKRPQPQPHSFSISLLHYELILERSSINVMAVLIKRSDAGVHVRPITVMRK